MLKTTYTRSTGFFTNNRTEDGYGRTQIIKNKKNIVKEIEWRYVPTNRKYNNDQQTNKYLKKLEIQPTDKIESQNIHINGTVTKAQEEFCPK